MHFSAIRPSVNLVPFRFRGSASASCFVFRRPGVVPAATSRMRVVADKRLQCCHDVPVHRYSLEKQKRGREEVFSKARRRRDWRGRTHQDAGVSGTRACVRRGSNQGSSGSNGAAGTNYNIVNLTSLFASFLLPHQHTSLGQLHRTQR